ncbi:MAG: ferritin family protein [Candidatus Altiarchaeota archaeon]
MMEEADEKIVKGLESAIELEMAGQKFYREAAERTADENGTEMFNFLADEEAEHESLLREKYVEIVGEDYEGGEDLEEVVIGRVFSERVSGGASGKGSDDLDALNIGINAEKESIELYGRLKKEAEDEELQDTFEMLVEAEERHLSLLETQVEFITETGEWHDFGTITA